MRSLSAIFSRALMSDDFIKNYWDSQAKTHQESHWASWGDAFMIDLEIETIAAHISAGETVLDVGCANGFSTFEIQKRAQTASICGVDYAPTMIAEAIKANENREGARIHFSIGDVRDLQFGNDQFDVVYTTRVLINLPTWDMQKKGIEECLRVTRPGGKVILSEGFWEPLVLLNAMRSLVGLEALVEHDFNRYLKTSRLEAFLDGLSLNYEIENFSSVYYLGSRFLREILTNPDDYPGYTNPVNKEFYDLERRYSGGDFGIQKAVVIKK
jgi:ubiquinone/menaquinone biosynthesis C-methylase UbiE